MFWGTVVDAKTTFKLDEDDLSKILNVTGASLGMNPPKGTLCLLNFDIYFSQVKTI